MVFRKIAARVRTLQGLYLVKPVRLRQIESGSAAWTSLDRRPRIIERAFNEVEVTGGVAEYPGAIGPPASMKGAGFVRGLVQHHPLHWGMMQIAQRSELLPGRHGPGFLPSPD
jgi:hypothetical protein